tara:strand:+ start:1747 stop:2010 length:264 start_codon:yes stop_codon:yes gene_type:complete
MDIKGPGYSHHYATQPLELIVKTQAAKEIQMDLAVKQRNWVEKTVENHREMKQSYDAAAETYNSSGKIKSEPQPVEGSTRKSVDIQA